MIEAILPPTIHSFDAFGDPTDAVLMPAEEELVRQVAEKRRREFTTARHCVRKAMERLGLPPAPILPGAYGEPCWPPGLIGSITHCDGYRAAAVGAVGGTVGIDAEPDAPLPPGVEEAVTLPGEREMLRRLAYDHPGVSWDRLLFSAKESVYKAWFPLTRRWLDFQDAAIVLDPERGAFHARLMTPGPRWRGRQLTGFHGRWTVGRGLLLTAIAMIEPAPSASSTVPPASVPRPGLRARGAAR
ncbi:4'-phosphopantetheinyl transferase superfamily protein [Nonomuraea sp. MCN248]|uniref:4'-phosphopantetheinyl transferase superfamily protein n=1 Tax=Nonomuraea corallina TaxID=2989783 RepID=A0ABT4SL07_9ACTN|nr:4'-phosphopantetheinyl transferase superfamily protein [Nonomuraea corallina]MDA0637903.1 4'-phosphopantetheinyl transferase superfamily protein [Nonomuraea corallina]